MDNFISGSGMWKDETIIGESEKWSATSTLLPPVQSHLIIDKDVIFNLPHPSPNWWWRMWQYILLGWKWEAE